MRKLVVFYSWQSDLEGNINRNFILTALENAAKAINKQDDIQFEAVIDRDTKDIAGSPHIAKTILEKIDQADLFVSDVSIINQGATRLAPNPNVLLELGYAIKSLGSDNKIILVMNTATGKPEDLPFDLRFKRVTQYKLTKDDPNKAQERKKLEGIFVGAFKMAIDALSEEEQTAQPASLSEQLIEAVRNGNPIQEKLATDYMDWLLNELESLNPDYSNITDGSQDELLVAAIDQTNGIVAEFSEIAETIAIYDASKAASKIYTGFSKIADKYYLPRNFSGSYYQFDFDFYKFIGHEIFVCFISFLISNEKWDTISELLDEDILVNNSQFNQPTFMPYIYANQYVYLFRDRKIRLKLPIISVHAEILKSRHSSGKIAALIPFDQFMNADFFLFLKSLLQAPTIDYDQIWRPSSIIYLVNPPEYLIKSEKQKYAQLLIKPLGLPSVEILRTRLKERFSEIKKFVDEAYAFRLLKGFDPDKIGSR